MMHAPGDRTAAITAAATRVGASVQSVLAHGVLLEHVAHRRSNLRAFGDTDQRAGDLKRTSLFPERLHDDGRSGLRFRVPLAVADFQTDRENTAGELTGGSEVPIRLDPWERDP